jgi:hypothetical protein
MFELMVELFFVSSVQRADTTHKRGSLTFLDRATQGRRQSVGRIVVGGPIPLGCGNLNISVKLQPSVTRVSRLTSCAQPARPRGPGYSPRVAVSVPSLSLLFHHWNLSGPQRVETVPQSGIVTTVCSFTTPKISIKHSLWLWYQPCCRGRRWTKQEGRHRLGQLACDGAIRIELVATDL